MGYRFLFKKIFFIAQIIGFCIGAEGSAGGFGPIQNWPKYDNFGQVSAVGVDNVGKVYVFHRGNRQWNTHTFIENNFMDRDKGPIPNDTIVVLEPDQGSLLKKTGSNLFFLPHGLTVDAENNIWVTDVALHQVFKFPPLDLSEGSGGLRTANLTLGVPFESGKDSEHFCKPTGVAVDRETKDFYVSDGYCNSRIVKFDQFGNYLLSFGRTSIGIPQNYMFNLPHAVALAQEGHALYVADRENRRVLSYNSQSAVFMKSFAEERRRRIFSVAYSPLEGGLLFVLANDNTTPNFVSIYSPDSGKPLITFFPKSNFSNPHDLAVSPDGRFCYVVELNPYKVWKMNLDLPLLFQKEDSSEGPEKLNEEVDGPVPAQNKVDKSDDLEGSNSFLAGGLVAFVVVISFLIFMWHYYKRKGEYRRYESRRLILDDDEGGIRLT